MDDSRVICSRRVSDDWTISAATVQSSLTRLDLFSSLYRGFQPIGIYTNYVQQNPTGGSRWIVQSQPTRTGRIPQNPTTGRWWIVQVQPARSTTENRGRD